MCFWAYPNYCDSDIATIIIAIVTYVLAIVIYCTIDTIAQYYYKLTWFMLLQYLLKSTWFLELNL